MRIINTKIGTYLVLAEPPSFRAHLRQPLLLPRHNRSMHKLSREVHNMRVHKPNHLSRDFGADCIRNVVQLIV